MKIKYKLTLLTLVSILLLSACSSSETSSNSDNSSNPTSDSDSNTQASTFDVNNVSTYTANNGRLLASQCAQCHGTNGYSVNDWDSIAGEDDLADEMFDDDEIMTEQAHGYTSAEITLIENWLKTLSKNNDNDDD